MDIANPTEPRSTENEVVTGEDAGLRERQKARNRAAILDAAMTCFIEYGYFGTSTAAIADRAELSTGTIHNYFADKEQILLELLSRDFATIGADVAQALTEEQSLEQMLHAMVMASFRLFLVKPELLQLVHSNLSLVRESIDGKAFEQMLAAFLDLPPERGGGGFENVDLELTFEATIGVSLEVGMAMIYRAPESADDAARYVSDLVLGGMLRMRTDGAAPDVGKRLTQAAQRHSEQLRANPGPDSDGSRERRKSENREAILDAAQQAFAQLGYQATGVRDISRRADLAAGTIYNHFSGKEEIFRLLADRYFGEFADQVGYCREHADSLEELVAGQFRCAFEFADKQPVMFEMINRNQSEIWRMMSSIKHLTRMVTELAVDTRAMMDQGILPESDADYTVVSILGVGFSVGRVVSRRGKAAFDAGVKFATDLFVGGGLKLSGNDPTTTLPPFERRFARTV